MPNAAGAEFTYETVAIPVATRAPGAGNTKIPNPHTDIVLSLRALCGTDTPPGARAITIHHVDDKGVVIPVAADKDGKAILPAPVTRVLRQLREPGDLYKNADGTPAPFSVRTLCETGSVEEGTGKNKRTVPATRVTFWIHTDDKGNAARITRTHKK
jgi:hypothetical protein